MTVPLSPLKYDSPGGLGRRLSVPVLSSSHYEMPSLGRRLSTPLLPSEHHLPVVDDGISSVRVAVRARPLIEKELVDSCAECVSYARDGKQVILGKDRRFTFDHVFGPDVSQEDVYKECVRPLVESCCSG